MPSTPEGAALWASLSKRERSIAIKFAEGLTYQQIGEALFIAPTTVRTHLATIYRKLDVHTKAALINLFVAQSASAVAPSQDVAPCPSVSLPGRAKPTPAPSPALKAQEAERRQLTVMFVDLIGSTELSARLDPEDLGELLRTYRSAVAGQIDRHGGRVAKFMGDGVLAYFCWPLAHEDDAERGVRAGLALAASVARLPSPVSKPLACRIGIATGLVVVGELIGEGFAQEEAVHGHTPNLAARLQALAQPGQIVIAESTRRLLGDIFELADLGARELKGIAEAANVFAVAAERPNESRFEARLGGDLLPMVGRNDELALVLGRWDQAKIGEGQGALLVGDAGIGKSRIVRAVLDEVAREPHTRIVYQCSPHHRNSALWPVIQQLGRACGFIDGDSPEARLKKLETMLSRGGPVSDKAPLFAALLGLDGGAPYGQLSLTPQAQRARTLEALVEQLLDLAKNEPVLVVLEDAHWIDPTTLELIEQCLGQIAEARVLILLTSRPDGLPGLVGRSHITRLTINRLGRVAVEAIIDRLSGDRGLPAEIIDAIITRADGVPLFVEELTKAVLETGEAAIPASLHDSLMARLDRFAEVKQVAQIAACIGREFSHRLLTEVAQRPGAELDAALNKLVAGELIFRRGTPPGASYSFKHALVQDAAYQSLLKGRRQQLHARIAQTLEQRFPDTMQSEPELLAHHNTAAGLTAVGAHYWGRAGARAIQRSAFVEASNYYGRGLELLSTLPDGQERNQLELSLQMGVGDALSWTRGFAAAEVEAAYNRAHELSRRMGETWELFQTLRGLWHFYVIRRDLERADELGQELSQLAQRLQDPSLAPHIHRTLGETLLWRGDFAAAQRETSKCLAGPDAAPKSIPGVQDPLVMCGFWRALALWHLGYPDRDLADVDAALERAKSSAHAGELGSALIVAAWVRLLRRETASACEFAEASLRFNAERGLTYSVAFGEVLLGSAVVAGRLDERGLTQMRNGIAGCSATGAGAVQPWFLALIAEGHAHFGECAAGLAALAEAESCISRTGERWPEAEVHRLKGKLTLSMDGTDVAGERCLRTAIEIARGQQAKSPELRAATSLAQLWGEQGERAKAFDLLAPIYDWFTEGFDTPDLIEAKMLLEALA